MNDFIPTVKITIDDMRHQIISQLSGCNRLVERAVDDGIKKAIERFDLSEFVTREAQAIIEAQLKKSVEHAVSRILWDPDVADAIRKAVIPIVWPDYRAPRSLWSRIKALFRRIRNVDESTAGASDKGRGRRQGV